MRLYYVVFFVLDQETNGGTRHYDDEGAFGVCSNPEHNRYHQLSNQIKYRGMTYRGKSQDETSP